MRAKVDNKKVVTLFVSPSGLEVTISPTQFGIVDFATRLVLAFEDAFGRITKLHDTKPFIGLSPDDALARIRAEQGQLLAHVNHLLTFVTDRGRLGAAFFKTLWQLAGGTLAVDPYAVIQKTSDNPVVRLIYP